MIELKIDPEFRDKIPAMPQEDFDGLKEDILRDGYVRDPLVVWKEENTLLDGHHRYRIIQENETTLGDKFQIDYKSFPDRWACIAWICANQLHKHNMTEIQRMKLIQEEYEARQKTRGAPIGNQNAKKQSGEIHHFESEEPELVKHGADGKELKTRPTIAKEHGITEGEVKTAVEVGRGIDRAAKVDPAFREKVLSGEIKASKKDLAAIRKMDSDEEIKDAIEEIKNKPKKSNVPAKKNDGRSQEIRASYDIIDKAIASMTNDSDKSTFTVADLADEIRANSSDFVAYLRRILSQRSEMLNEEGARETIRDVIDEITNSIMNVRSLI